MLAPLFLWLLGGCQEDQSAFTFQELNYNKVRSSFSAILFNNNGDLLTQGVTDMLIPIEVSPATAVLNVTTSTNWSTAEIVKAGGDNFVKIDVTPNDGDERIAQVRIMTGTGADEQGLILYVRQEPAISVNPSNLLAKAIAETHTLQILSSGSWTVEKDAPWLTLGQTTGTGDASLTVSVGLNTSVEPRTATLIFTVGGYKTEVLVSQSGNILVEDMIDMTYVEGGTFNMGCTPEQLATGSCSADEQLPRMVTVNSFYISQYMVTQDLWRTVMGADHPTMFEGPRLPVETVSWDDAQEFLEKLNELTGKQYRLATEAEWEYAARGGRLSQTYVYSGSNSAAQVAWYSKTLTQDVGLLAPNELGLYDMSGLLYEWVSDWYQASFPATPLVNPTGPLTGDRKVLKGGSYRNGVANVRVSKRAREPRDRRSDNIGFRIAL